MLKTLIMKAAFIAFVGSISFAAHAIADTQRFNVPAGDLVAALESFAKQANVDLVYQDEQVKGLRTGGVSGDFSPRDAVMKLLEGTPLQLRTDEASGALLITTPMPSGGRASSSTSATDENPARAADRTDTAAAREKRSFWDRLRLAQAETDASAQGVRTETRSSTDRDFSRASAEPEKSRIELEEILVTGTHIRGAEVSSPVVTITQEEMRLSGHNTLGEVIRALPQNFSGGQNPGIQFGFVAGDLRNGNATGSSGINLRGLGADATLTLLNGTRLPYDGFRQATDVANIPVEMETHRKSRPVVEESEPDLTLNALLGIQLIPISSRVTPITHSLSLHRGMPPRCTSGRDCVRKGVSLPGLALEPSASELLM